MALIINNLLLHIYLFSVIKTYITSKSYEEMEINMNNEDQMKAIELSCKEILLKYGEGNINESKLLSIYEMSTSVYFYRLLFAINPMKTNRVDIMDIYIVSSFEQSRKVMKVYTGFKVDEVIDITIHFPNYIYYQKKMVEYFNRQNNNQRLDNITAISQYEFDTVIKLEVNGKNKVYILHRKNIQEHTIYEFL